MDALVELVEEQSFKFTFPQPDRVEGNIIGLVNVNFAYPSPGILKSGEAAPLGPILLRDVNVAVDMDSRIGILGANGVGQYNNNNKE